MPLPFVHVCSLLGELESLEQRAVPLLRPEHKRATRAIIETWFKKHRATIDAPSANGVALLSTLFPEKRTDRVYGLQETRLSGLVARCLSFSAKKTAQLQLYQKAGNGDLAACAERLLRDYDVDHTSRTPVLVDEIDLMLARLASNCRFSSPAARALPMPLSSQNSEQLLRPLLLRMRSFEVKWLIRLILKDFAPVILDFDRIIVAYHFLLPGLLRFQDSFEAAVGLLKEQLKRYHANPDPASQILLKKQAAEVVRPRIGIKLGRPAFHKARSIEHCLKMADGKRWAVERKYDGEYCEVHIDLRDGHDRIKVYSKSGKDSTQDRLEILQSVSESLQIGTPNCRFRQQSILVGELVVYSDETRDILPFHKIRKHISRSGRFIGTDRDSQPHEHEHLMVIFFDVLLIDDEVTLTKPYDVRRQRLKDIVKKLSGRCMTSEWRIVDFAQAESKRSLIHHFTVSVALRHEGLVLKPADAPYFSLLDDEPGQWHSGFIKLKKDYLQSLGEERDVVDLVVVGASYNARQAQKMKDKKMKWTTFHLGCLANAEEVRFGKMPVFQIVGMIHQDQCIPDEELRSLNQIATFYSMPFEINGDRLMHPNNLDLILDSTPDSKMGVVLTKPVVVEILGSGFEKPPNKDFFMLRHPRILKVHLDREWNDAVTLDGLARLAQITREAPEEGQSQEMTRLMEKLLKKASRKSDDGSLRSSLTPLSSTTVRSTMSPRSPLLLRSGNVPGRLTSSRESPARPARPDQRPVHALKPKSSDCSCKFLQKRAPPEGATGRSNQLKASHQAGSPQKPAQFKPPGQAQISQQASYITPFVVARDNVDTESSSLPTPGTLETASTKRSRGSDESRLEISASKRQRTRLGGHKATQQPRRDNFHAHIMADLAEENITSAAEIFDEMSEGSPDSTPGLTDGDSRSTPEDLRRLSQSSEDELSLHHKTCALLGPACICTTSVFYVSDEVPEDVINLLEEHHATSVRSLELWAREDEPPPDGYANWIPESQAYPRKNLVVLVDMTNIADVHRVAKKLQALRIKRPIDFFDYGVVSKPGTPPAVIDEAVQKQLAIYNFVAHSYYDSEAKAVVASFNDADWEWSEHGRHMVSRWH